MCTKRLKITRARKKQVYFVTVLIVFERISCFISRFQRKFEEEKGVLGVLYRDNPWWLEVLLLEVSFQYDSVIRFFSGSKGRTQRASDSSGRRRRRHSVHHPSDGGYGQPAVCKNWVKRKLWDTVPSVWTLGGNMRLTPECTWHRPLGGVFGVSPMQRCLMASVT